MSEETTEKQVLEYIELIDSKDPEFPYGGGLVMIPFKEVQCTYWSRCDKHAEEGQGLIVCLKPGFKSYVMVKDDKLIVKFMELYKAWFEKHYGPGETILDETDEYFPDKSIYELPKESGYAPGLKKPPQMEG